MKTIAKGIAVGMIAASLSACSVFSATNVDSLMTSAAGTAILAALGVGGALIPGLNNVIADIDKGITGGGRTALNTVCYTLPWADAAVDLFGVAAGIPATTITEIDASVVAFKAGPCTTPPANVAQVLTQGISLFIAIENTLGQGGVPVAVPVSTSIARTAF